MATNTEIADTTEQLTTLTLASPELADVEDASWGRPGTTDGMLEVLGPEGRSRPDRQRRADRPRHADRPDRDGRRSRADRAARKVLRVRDLDGQRDIYNIFSSSMVLSGVRCLLSYIVFPVLAPWLGALPVVGPAIGVPVGVAALVFDVRAIRRFFQADHRWRWAAAAVYLVVMAMVASLLGRDIYQLAG